MLDFLTKKKQKKKMKKKEKKIELKLKALTRHLCQKAIFTPFPRKRTGITHK